jgi:hypothetical protein
MRYGINGWNSTTISIFHSFIERWSYNIQ